MSHGFIIYRLGHNRRDTISLLLQSTISAIIPHSAYPFSSYLKRRPLVINLTTRYLVCLYIMVGIQNVIFKQYEQI